MNRRVRIGLLVSVVLICIFGDDRSHGEQTQSSSYQVISDKFFNILKQGNASDAVDYIFGTNPTLQRMTDETEQLKAQFNSLGKLSGHYISHTMLAETTVAGTFVYQHYFVAYDRQPVSVRIEYYKPGTTWECYSLQFDSKLADHIQEAVDARIPIDMK